MTSSALEASDGGPARPQIRRSKMVISLILLSLILLGIFLMIDIERGEK